MRIVLLLLLAMLAVPLVASEAQAQVDSLRPAPTPADTDSVLILHGAFTYPGYWWDHTQLTVAVQAHPNVEAESLAAVRQAIADWDDALQQGFGGLITLTDVTDELTAKHKADVVLHYDPTARGDGVRWLCDLRAQHKCPNVIVRSDLPPSLGLDPYSPQYLYYVTMHELGRALGLGHGEPLLESTDLMGYGWNRTTASCRFCRTATSKGSQSSSRGRSKASSRIRRRTLACTATTRPIQVPHGTAARVAVPGTTQVRRLRRLLRGSARASARPAAPRSPRVSDAGSHRSTAEHPEAPGRRLRSGEARHPARPPRARAPCRRGSTRPSARRTCARPPRAQARATAPSATARRARRAGPERSRRGRGSRPVPARTRTASRGSRRSRPRGRQARPCSARGGRRRAGEGSRRARRPSVPGGCPALRPSPPRKAGPRVPGRHERRRCTELHTRRPRLGVASPCGVSPDRGGSPRRRRPRRRPRLCRPSRRTSRRGTSPPRAQEFPLLGGGCAASAGAPRRPRGARPAPPGDPHPRRPRRRPEQGARRASRAASRPRARRSRDHADELGGSYGWCRPRGTTIGVPLTGSGTTSQARPKTSSTSSASTTSRGRALGDDRARPSSR